MSNVDRSASPPPTPMHGRGASSNPANRFEPLHIEPDPEEEHDPDRRGRRTLYLRDFTRTIIAHNESPDVGFSAGLDFESRIMVKEDAPELLAKELASPRWQPQTLVMSGVTDPYQPVERKLQITRRCLEVLVRFRNPVAIITKNHL